MLALMGFIFVPLQTVSANGASASHTIPADPGNNCFNCQYIQLCLVVILATFTATTSILCLQVYTTHEYNEFKLNCTYCISSTLCSPYTAAYSFHYWSSV